MERPIPTPDDESAHTQRVRIGLTGLGCVFLLVLLAASLFGLVGESPLTPAGGGSGNSANAVAAAADGPKDPLAELGVAPGNAPDHPVGNESAPIAARTSRPAAPRSR